MRRLIALVIHLMKPRPRAGLQRDHVPMSTNRWCDRGHEPVGWARPPGSDVCWFCGEEYRTVSKPDQGVPKSIRNPDSIAMEADRDDIPNLDDPDYWPVSISGV